MKFTKYRALVGAMAASLATLAIAGDLPDAHLTPGAVDPAVTQENLHRTVCVKGYTKSVRPPAYYTNALKKKQMRQYRVPNPDPRLYQEDHLIPLSIGGAPSDERNLWPQPRNTEFGAEEKDELELRLMKLVCSGRLPLAQAQREVASNWIETYKKYGGEKYRGGFTAE